MIKIETLRCGYITGKQCYYIPKGRNQKDTVDDLLNHIFNEHDELTESILLRADEIIASINKFFHHEHLVHKKK